MDVIFDVDPGVDDALAILLALASPELNVRALTVVCGNVPLDIGVDNALRLLKFADREDIPVYSGANSPLSRPAVHATEVHGETGLGNTQLAAAQRSAIPDAVGFLSSTLNAEPARITLIAVGPLTNLSQVERVAPGTLNRAKRVIVMGGAVSEPGNATPSAEFNFFVDPEAAAEVVRAVDRLTIVPLDVTHQVGVSAVEIEESIRPLGTERAGFFCGATEVVVRLGAQWGGYEGVYLHDPAAVAMAIAPDLFDVKSMWVDVETDGRLTSGQLVADRRAGVAESKRKGVRRGIALGVKSDQVLDMFRKRVLGL